ncbi:MAG: AbrB/MazE/SpoVT family DNA-binding domain-containing protein [Methanobacterium sp. ERen5]|nr:MAG: AbrB/MazE/SpoVT family DNA-binding domain-containing protein [Methanobacterium sp. ERen5]
MEFESTLSKAKSTGSSLRTTIPLSIIKAFELKDGDKIKWDCEIKDDTIIVKVTPLKKE